jgi:Flp pilus assembly protein TadD
MIFKVFMSELRSIFWVIALGLFGSGALALAFGERLEIERARGVAEDKLRVHAKSGRYSFEVLLDGARILLKQKSYLKAQELFELAREMRPRNLEVLKSLAVIYENTHQKVLMAEMAESISSFLLPQGADDEFYVKMLRALIVQNSKSHQEIAWRAFQKLLITLKKKPGRLHTLIRELERETYIPFLARAYGALRKARAYSGYRWGEIGDYYLVQGDHTKAKKYLQLEMDTPAFDRRFLYSYALTLYSLRQFTLSQVYVNLGQKLCKDLLVLNKLHELQNSLGQHIYALGKQELQKEAELLFRFGEKKLAVERLSEFLLLSPENALTWLEMGEFLLKYPKDYGTWPLGKDYVLRFAHSHQADFQNLLRAATLLYRKQYLEEIAIILRILDKRFADLAAGSKRVKILRKKVLIALKDDISIFEAHGSKADLKHYLLLVLELDPDFLVAILKLSEVFDSQVNSQLGDRKFVSEELKVEIGNFLPILENSLKSNPRIATLHFFLGRFKALLSPEQRRISQEILHFKRAIQLNEDYSLARVYLAKTYHENGFLRSALGQLEQLKLQTDSDSLELIKEVAKLRRKVHLELAFRAYGNGNHFLVLEHIGKALIANQDQLINRDSSLWYASALVHTEQYEKSEDLILRAIKLFGGDSETYYLLALSQEGMYKLDEAIQTYGRAVDLSKPGSLFALECRRNMMNLKQILEGERE